MSKPFDESEAIRSTGHLAPDQIIDLTQGLLDRAEAGAAMSHVRGCQICADALRECAASVERIAAGPQPTVLANGTIALDERKGGSPSALPRRPHRIRSAGRRMVVLGAVLSTAVAATLIVMVLRSDTLVADPYWVPVENRTVSRAPDIGAGPSNTAPSDFDAALDAYAKRNLPRAIEGLEAARPPEDVDPLRRLYLASAYVLDGRPGQAVQTLEKLDIDSLPQPWRSRAWWTLYLATRDAGYGERAQALLDKLRVEGGRIGDLVREEMARLH